MRESVSARFENVSADFGFGTANSHSGSATRYIHNCNFSICHKNAFLKLCWMAVLEAARVVGLKV